MAASPWTTRARPAPTAGTAGTGAARRAGGSPSVSFADACLHRGEPDGWRAPRESPGDRSPPTAEPRQGRQAALAPAAEFRPGGAVKGVALILGSRVSDDCGRPCNFATWRSMTAVLAAASSSLAVASFARRSRSRVLRCCSARFASCSAARCAAAHSRYDPGESERRAIIHPLTISYSCRCERNPHCRRGQEIPPGCR
jgi:hypothetical protein